MTTDNTIHVSNCPTCGHFPTQLIRPECTTTQVQYRALPTAQPAQAIGPYRLQEWLLQEHDILVSVMDLEKVMQTPFDDEPDLSGAHHDNA